MNFEQNTQNNSQDKQKQAVNQLNKYQNIEKDSEIDRGEYGLKTSKEQRAEEVSAAIQISLIRSFSMREVLREIMMRNRNLFEGFINIEQLWTNSLALEEQNKKELNRLADMIVKDQFWLEFEDCDENIDKFYNENRQLLQDKADTIQEIYSFGESQSAYEKMQFSKRGRAMVNYYEGVLLFPNQVKMFVDLLISLKDLGKKEILKELYISLIEKYDDVVTIEEIDYLELAIEVVHAAFDEDKSTSKETKIQQLDDTENKEENKQSLKSQSFDDGKQNVEAKFRDRKSQENNEENHDQILNNNLKSNTKVQIAGRESDDMIGMNFDLNLRTNLDFDQWQKERLRRQIDQFEEHCEQDHQFKADVENVIQLRDNMTRQRKRQILQKMMSTPCEVQDDGNSNYSIVFAKPEDSAKQEIEKYMMYSQRTNFIKTCLFNRIQNRTGKEFWDNILSNQIETIIKYYKTDFGAVDNRGKFDERIQQFEFEEDLGQQCAQEKMENIIMMKNKSKNCLKFQRRLGEKLYMKQERQKVIQDDKNDNMRQLDQLYKAQSQYEIQEQLLLSAIRGLSIIQEDLIKPDSKSFYELQKKPKHKYRQLWDLYGMIRARTRVWIRGRKYLCRVTIPIVMNKCSMSNSKVKEKESSQDQFREMQEFYYSIDYCNHRSFQTYINFVNRLLTCQENQIYLFGSGKISIDLVKI